MHLKYSSQKNNGFLHLQSTLHLELQRIPRPKCNRNLFPFSTKHKHQETGKSGLAAAEPRIENMPLFSLCERERAQSGIGPVRNGTKTSD